MPHLVTCEPVFWEHWVVEESNLVPQMVITMSMGERLYTGNGSGVIAHSIHRKRTVSLNGKARSPGRNVSPGRHAGSLRVPRRRINSSSASLSNTSTFSSPIKSKTTSFSSATLSRSFPHLPSSSPSCRSATHLPQTPPKRLELALDKFCNIALPFYLQIISRHTSNIIKVNHLEDSQQHWLFFLQLLEDSNQSELSLEVKRASRSVRNANL